MWLCTPFLHQCFLTPFCSVEKRVTMPTWYVKDGDLRSEITPVTDLFFLCTVSQVIPGYADGPSRNSGTDCC